MRGTVRSGFTLLEVVVAMAIAVLLLGGLYVVLRVQMDQMQRGRELSQHNAVARALIERISNDISAHLGPVDPRVVSAEAIQEAASSTGANSSTETATNDTEKSTNDDDKSSEGSDSTASSSANSKSSSEDMSATESAASSTGSAFFNLGVQGDTSCLHLTISQGPKDADRSEMGGVSDLRRVSYWLAGTTEVPLGLARYEVKLATSGDGLTTQLPPDATPYIVSSQVANVMFEYFDGSAWHPFWDGRQLMADGKTPLGPPAAVAITLTIAGPESQPGVQRLSTVRHVVFVPASNGAGSGLGGMLP